MKEARRVEHTKAERQRAALCCLCFLAAVSCAFAGIETDGWVSQVIGGVALLLCLAGYLLIR